jgi:DNA-binding MarR family transcriptional regulator
MTRIPYNKITMNEDLYQSLFEIVTFFNRPQQDKLLLNRAGVKLDTALFPIIVRVGVHEKTGIVKLANELGRDYTTVSRQVDKLEAAALIVSDTPDSDRRIREIRLTDQGKMIVEKIVEARWALMNEALLDWDDSDLSALKSSLDHLAKSLAQKESRK